MPGEGPTWLTGLVVLRTARDRERMFADYVKIRPPLEVYQRGLVELRSRDQALREGRRVPRPGCVSRRASGRTSVSRTGRGRRLHLLLQSVSAGPRAGRSGAAGRSADVGGVHLPGAGHPDGRTAARSRAGRPPALRLEEANPARSPGAARQAVKAGTLKPDEALLHLQRRGHRQDGAGHGDRCTGTSTGGAG